MDHQIDAKNKKLGRLASGDRLASSGQKSPKYNPRLLNDDLVIVKNASQIEVTGKKTSQKNLLPSLRAVGRFEREHKVSKISIIDPVEKQMEVIVDDSQLSLAIRKEGRTCAWRPN